MHGAVITGIDTEKQYVSVEWFENGETKGKEVVLSIWNDQFVLVSMPTINSELVVMCIAVSCRWILTRSTT